MTVEITNGFVIALFGLYTFFCVCAGLFVGSGMIAKQIVKQMHMNIDKLISQEEKKIKRTNIK